MALQMKVSMLLILCRPLISLILVVPLNWQFTLKLSLVWGIVQDISSTVDSGLATQNDLGLFRSSSSLHPDLQYQKMRAQYSYLGPPLGDLEVSLNMRPQGCRWGRWGFIVCTVFFSFEWMTLLGLLPVTPSSDPPTTDWKLQDPPTPTCLGFQEYCSLISIYRAQHSQLFERTVQMYTELWEKQKFSLRILDEGQADLFFYRQ